MKLDRVYIEISNICNVQCSFCPVVERDNLAMNERQFVHILKQVKPYTDEVCLHLMGEPLAHPKFIDKLDLCKKEDLQVQITTNGLLINRYQDRILADKSVRQINFSLQSYTDNFPDKPLDGYLDKIINFCKQASNIRPELYINLRLWNDGDTTSSNKNEDILCYIEKELNIEIKRQVDVSNIKSKKIWNRVYLHFDSRFKWPDPKDAIVSTRGRCNGVLRHMGIHADGKVVPCCLDKEACINLGNIFEQSFESIVNSKRTCAIRDGFLNNKLIEDLCQKCDFISRFRK
ncbi:MAG: radical SAM protein [Bacteriovoracaceae bacterium]|jgi:radical SAM protein with 4Fe4S-binding SPASM domain|nr:radical SAM protein [Bacteriovoracaceae bacterium]